MPNIPAGSPEVTHTTEDGVSPREGCREILDVIRRSTVQLKGHLFLHTVPRNRLMKGKERGREGRGGNFCCLPQLGGFTVVVVACV